MAITPTERKQRIADLKKEHEFYFQTEGKNNVLYIPKMAYRPSGKDELHVSFFLSELEKDQDIYTEIVSIDYEIEDSKRTLYLIKYNPHWKSEYELITSNSGFQRHLIPVSELKVINDVTDRGKKKFSTSNIVTENLQETLFVLNDPDETPSSSLVDKLEDINQSIITLTKVITKLIK